MTHLETDHLLLRSLSPDDLPRLHATRNAEACARYQRWERTDETFLRAMIEEHAGDAPTRPGKQQFAIADKATGEMVGDLTLFIEDPTLTVGYTIAPAHQRKGYATELLSALAAHLHEMYPARELVALVDPQNAPSIALLNKLGFENLGYAPPIDSIVFALWPLDEE